MSEERDSRERLAGFALLGLATAAVVGVVIAYLSRPPQMGPDEEVFHTVDALFTAVTARNEKQLGQCEQRLRGYRDAGKLPAAAADSLDGFIRQARSGGWQSAAERLYRFMLAQRRDGAEANPRTPSYPPPKGKASLAKRKG
ncbi:MAG: hypothetical protein U0797_11140 [Gemmataceae bacterium]